MARNPRSGGIFQSPKSKLEVKADATTRAVRQIIAQESAENAAKTERLRAARLARDAGIESIPTKSKNTQKTR